MEPLLELLGDERIRSLLESLVYTFTVLGGLYGALAMGAGFIGPRWRSWRDRRSLGRHLIPGHFSPQQIDRAVRFWVEPETQQTDPSGQEEHRALAPVRSPLLQTLHELLDLENDQRFAIILADSGMGKTTALLNYYALHLRRAHRGGPRVAVLYLGYGGLESSLHKVKSPEETILLLDALDEDVVAARDHRGRIRTLVDMTRHFRGVVITCRTQFFADDEEIPKETGILRIGPRSAGEAHEYTFQKVYLSPFSDQLVRKYLRKRYPLWRYPERREAEAIVRRIPRLSARPMILAYVEDLRRGGRSFATSFELYEEIVRQWIERERRHTTGADSLLQLSQRLAMEIFLNRTSRGGEFVGADELETLVDRWGFPQAALTIRSRSLLNRDAEGRYKFAHRSIMEYLLVKSVIEGEDRLLQVRWTDQMATFFVECVSSPTFVSSVAALPDDDPLVRRVFIALLDRLPLTHTGFSAMLRQLESSPLVSWSVLSAIARLDLARAAWDRVTVVAVTVSPAGIRLGDEWEVTPAASGPAARAPGTDRRLGLSRGSGRPRRAQLANVQIPAAQAGAGGTFGYLHVGRHGERVALHVSSSLRDCGIETSAAVEALLLSRSRGEHAVASPGGATSPSEVPVPPPVP